MKAGDSHVLGQQGQDLAYLPISLQDLFTVRTASPHRSHVGARLHKGRGVQARTNLLNSPAPREPSCPQALSMLIEMFGLHFQMSPFMSAQGEKTKQQEEKVVLERNASEQLLQPHSLCCHRANPFKSGKAEIKGRVSTLIQIYMTEDLLSLQHCSKSWHNIVLLALGEVLQTLDPSAGKSWVLFLAPHLWSLTIFSIRLLYKLQVP